MKKWYLTPLVILSLMALSLEVWGAPKAVITGVDKEEPGNLVILKTAGSQGLGHSWSVIPPIAEKYFLAVEKGTSGVFACKYPGTYYFVLSVSESDVVNSTTHTLVLGEGGPGPLPPGPGPKPPGPGPLPPDPGLTGMAKVSYDLAMNNVPALGRKEAALRLASSIDGVCAAISAGAIRKPTEAREEMRRANNEALVRGSQTAEVWKEKFAAPLSIELSRQEAAGKLSDIKGYKTIWEEIATGLKKVN